MRVSILILIIYQITIASRAEKFLPRHQTELLAAPEFRYRPARDYPQREHSHYNDDLRRDDYSRRVDFEPPHLEPPHQWRQDRDNYNRRTFFHDYPYGTTTPLFQFVTSVFGGSDTTENYRYNRPTPPYPFEPPFVFRPTEPNYIPPPKPIRASVIKLESITRSPIYSSFEGETTTKYYHNVGSLLNQVLIENSKNQQNLQFHQQEEIKIPPFKPLPVLAKPRYVPPTITPAREDFRYNQTGYNKYPVSVQDQLPHLNQGHVEIPYVSEKTIPQIFDPLPKKGRFEFFPSPDQSATTNVFGLIDIRSLNLSNPIDTTTIKSFPGAVEKVKRPVFKKKLSTHLDKLTVERVTNLTVEGFSKLGKENANKQSNYLNVKNLIRYEMNRLGNVTKLSEVRNTTKRPVNLNDELSLDAKILKDTNWDGLTIQQTTPPTEETTETVKPKPAFWEIVAAESTTPPTTEAVKPTTTEKSKPDTTTELYFTTEINDPTTKETTTTPKTSQRRSQYAVIPVTEEPETIEVTTIPEKTLRRRYSRRPKVVSFTPYPTTEELQKRLTNRSHFPKRQKPNITLAFGNKNVLKNIQNFAKDEVMKFSDEEVRKRRKTGKRRQLYKRVRASTSERTMKEEFL